MSLAEIHWMFMMLLPSVFPEAQSAIEYTFNTGMATWNQAQRHCQERGSKLLTLKTEEKYKSYTDFYLELTRSGIIQKGSQWIGLYDSNPPNMNHTWTDCTPLSPLFSPWMQLDDEPNHPKTQLCVRMNGNFEWRTTSCEDTREFTCERDIANCWFEQIDGRLENIAYISRDSLDDCQSKCLKLSTCEAFQLRDFKCHGSKSNIITAHGDEITYRKVCINYTITDDDFSIENPPLREGTVDCNSASTTMQKNFGQSIVHSHSNHFLNSLSQQLTPMTTDLQSTPYSSFAKIEASPMTKPLASEHIEILSMTIDIPPKLYPTELQSVPYPSFANNEASPMTESQEHVGIQPNPYSTAGDTDASVMTTDVLSIPIPIQSIQYIEASPMTTNLQLTFNEMSVNIEGPSIESGYTSATIGQSLSASNKAIQVSPHDLVFETSSAVKTILTTEELRSTPTSSEFVHLTTGSPTRLRSVSTKCTCVCKKRRGKVEGKILDTKKELTLNTTKLSSFIRKKTSAMDSRTTAKASGMLGIVIFVLTGLGLVFIDAITLGPKLCNKQNI